MRWDGKPSNHTFRLLSIPGTAFLPVWPYCMNARWNRCQDLPPWRTGGHQWDALLLRGWRLSSRTWNNHSLKFEWSNWRDSESSILETDVYVWCYALIVVHARNDDDDRKRYSTDRDILPLMYHRNKQYRHVKNITDFVYNLIAHMWISKPVSAWKSRNPSNTEFAFRRRLRWPIIHRDTITKWITE